MIEKFENWSDYELGMIAKAFMDCENCMSCKECSCDGVLCNNDDFIESRESFVREFEKRVME